MAHIVDCLLDADQEDLSLGLGLNNYIAKAVTHKDSNDSLGRASPSGEKPFAWRMQQPERKYQLFPKDKQTATAPGKPLDPGQAYALAMAQNGDKCDKPAGPGLKIRIKEHHNLTRRRKISVPELGPMTTVQEASMDSPTIPGRPPVHERSISAPGTSWKPYNVSIADCMSTGRTRTPTPDEKSDFRSNVKGNEELQRCQNEPARPPASPKTLTPLVIPTSNSSAPILKRQISAGRLVSSSNTAVDTSSRLGRVEDSPMSRSPFSPFSASMTTPRSATLATTPATLPTPLSAAPTFTTLPTPLSAAPTITTLPTPLSAPGEHRSSPKPWDQPAIPEEPTPESSPAPKPEISETTQSNMVCHRRIQSDTGSIMERGRPRKRSETTCGAVKRTGSKRSKSAEKRAQDQLPTGWKAAEAVTLLEPTEVVALQKQALAQAARFEVLRKEDVDNLSKELRQLDERVEYLRRTYTTLRAGRRNLHTRICQYLRSPRMAKFSQESILKQEEVLAEFDSSIDDWVTKLEQAENRRTRVRQKLLEHIAAAATLGIVSGNVMGVSETLQLALGVRPLTATTNLSTPPRSPTKTSFTPPPPPPPQSSSPPPHRAQVPSTILEQPLFEDEAAMEMKKEETKAAAPEKNEQAVRAEPTTEVVDKSDKVDRPESEEFQETTKSTLRRAETIRIYADNDVYALLADVENTITQMGGGDSPLRSPPIPDLPDEQRKELCRARSHDILNGGSPARKPLPISKLAEKPSMLSLSSAAKPATPPPGEFYLPATVFKPQ